MANMEGIIFADLFITNKEIFVDFFENYYIENEGQLKKVIMNLNKVLSIYTTSTITKAMAKDFSKAWNDFQKHILLNQGDLQLIVAYRGQGGKDAEFSQIIKQSDVEGEAYAGNRLLYGIDSGNKLVQDSMEALKASEVEKFLQVHLNGFLNQLEKSITKPQATKIHDFHEYCLSSNLQNTKLPHITGMKWRQAFYSANDGFYFGGRGLGQAYDAFMNHLADKKKWIYDYLVSGGLSNTVSTYEKIQGADKTVYSEEGGVDKKGHYAELLRDSQNHIGWYTGGDIIIVSPKTMQVVYNIQLKTTTRNTMSVFGERINSIRNFLNGFINLTPRQKGERIFDFFLTSVSNRSDFNNKPQEEIDDLTKDLLMKKINFTII